MTDTEAMNILINMRSTEWHSSPKVEALDKAIVKLSQPWHDLRANESDLPDLSMVYGCLLNTENGGRACSIIHWYEGKWWMYGMGEVPEKYQVIAWKHMEGFED